jgi:hypothetical protein
MAITAFRYDGAGQRRYVKSASRRARSTETVMIKIRSGRLAAGLLLGALLTMAFPNSRRRGAARGLHGRRHHAL